MITRWHLLAVALLVLAASALGASQPFSASANSTAQRCSPGLGMPCNVDGSPKLVKTPDIICSTEDGQYSFKMRIIGRANNNRITVNRIRYQFSPRDTQSRANKIQIIAPRQGVTVWEKGNLRRSSSMRSITLKRSQQIILPLRTRFAVVATFGASSAGGGGQCQQLFAVV